MQPRDIKIRLPKGLYEELGETIYARSTEDSYKTDLLFWAVKATMDEARINTNGAYLLATREVAADLMEWIAHHIETYEWRAEINEWYDNSERLMNYGLLKGARAAKTRIEAALELLAAIRTP